MRDLVEKNLGTADYCTGAGRPEIWSTFPQTPKKESYIIHWQFISFVRNLNWMYLNIYPSCESLIPLKFSFESRAPQRIAFKLYHVPLCALNSLESYVIWISQGENLLTAVASYNPMWPRHTCTMCLLLIQSKTNSPVEYDELKWGFEQRTEYLQTSQKSGGTIIIFDIKLTPIASIQPSLGYSPDFFSVGTPPMSPCTLREVKAPCSHRGWDV